MMRNVLRWELKSNLELDHPDFIATYLAEIPQVDDAATAVFKKCCDGKDPLYTTGYGWRGWEDGDEKGVQRSLEGCVSKFMKFLEEASIEPPSQRRFVPSPNTPARGAVKRKPDLCVAAFAGESIGVPAKPNKQIASWRQVLVAIELKSSAQDGLEKTWSDVMKYARESSDTKIPAGLSLDSPYVDPPCGFGNLIDWAPRLQWHLISIKMALSL